MPNRTNQRQCLEDDVRLSELFAAKLGIRAGCEEKGGHPLAAAMFRKASRQQLVQSSRCRAKVTALDRGHLS